MMNISIQPLSLDEFVERYGEQGPFEYIDGEMIPITPKLTRPSLIKGELFLSLAPYIRKHHLGIAFMDTPFVITLDRSQWVVGSRTPDVMFYSTERFEQFKQDYPDWKSIPVVGAPDFVAEIVSPTDRFTKVSTKISRYMADGVKLLWAFDWEAKTAQVHIPESNHITSYNGDAVLKADPIIPGYELKLAEFFKD
jgi:Uma2 family endonuclease